MELNRFSQRLTIVVTMVLGLVGAVALGKMAAEGNVSRILLIGGAALGVTLLLVLKERIWMLLLIGWPMTGQIRALNIPLGVRDIIVLIVFAGFVLLIAFKVVRKRNPLSIVDVSMLAILTMLVIAFTRNPAGVEALGSERVGGRPYFNAIMALLAWWVLSRSNLGSASPALVFFLIVFGRAIDGVLATFLFAVPQAEGLFAEFYSSPSMTLGASSAEGTDSPLSEGTGRLTFLGILGMPILIAMFSTYRPLAWLSLARPWRPLLLAVAVGFMMKSGFRSALLVVMSAAVFSAYLRNGGRELLKMTGIGLGILIIAVTCHGTFFELPRNIQRTLSFLPGNWDAVAVDDAQTSTEWRIYMWKEALLTDRFIENKALGDGFGMKKSDFATMGYFSKLGTVEGIRENLMIAGNFHSGPVTTIRYVGYIGLTLYLILISQIAHKAWVLCKKMRFTPLSSLAFLICLPLMIEPFIFVFVFGSFDSALPDAIYNIGLLKLLESAISKPVDQAPRPLPLPSGSQGGPRLTVSNA